MDLQCYQLCSQEITELASAMLKVQATLQPAIKDQDNPLTDSRYATLNAVMNACKDALISNGVWMAQYPVASEPGHLALVTKLTHTASGQFQASVLHMPLPQADPQGYGSAMTYARRYALSALLGMICEDDDDGNAARSRENGSQNVSHQTVANSGSISTPTPATKAAPGDSHNASRAGLASMPKLDGVNYQQTTETDGKVRIIASGDTFKKKKLLAQSGFQWDEQQKIWWRYAA